MSVSINIKTIVSNASHLDYGDFFQFEQKIKGALNRGLNGCSQEIFCTIGIDGHLPEAVKDQFAKIKSNIFVGFIDNTIEASMRRATLFELMAINDDQASLVNHIVILISGKPILQSNMNSNNDKYSSNEDDSLDQTTTYVATIPRYDLERVILDDSTRIQIMRSIALINNQKLIFETWGFRDVDPNTKTILCFYGAPGTGKTMCAHALAKELGKNILIASYASIESKWVGEGPKNMRKIFEDASKQDALLFFDEADSFLSKRVNNAETGSDKHYNRMSNEMFQLLEEFDGVVIFATNLVTDFDKAFKSRILSFVEFTLPDSKTRKKLIQTMIPSKLPLATPLAEYEYEILSSASESFSGREIRKALLTSLSEAALNSKSEISIDDLLVGFISVQTERKAIEETASKERNIISDYFEVSDQNKYILEVCQWGISQFENLTDSTRETLYKISKLLNLEMPDLSISYKHKNLDSACQSIINANRVKETLRYMVYLLGNLDLKFEEAEKTLTVLCEKLHFENRSMIRKYLGLYKSII